MSRLAIICCCVAARMSSREKPRLRDVDVTAPAFSSPGSDATRVHALRLATASSYHMFRMSHRALPSVDAEYVVSQDKWNMGVARNAAIVTGKCECSATFSNMYIWRLNLSYIFASITRSRS
jgi:hypothetical protein